MFNLPKNHSDVSIFILLLFNTYVVAWWLEIGKRISVLGSIRFEFMLGLLLGIIAIVRLMVCSITHDRNTSIKFVTIFFIIILSLNIPMSLDTSLAWETFVNKVLKYSLMSFFISQFVTSIFSLKLFLFSSFLAFFKIGQEAIHGKITGSMVWENQGIPRLHGTLDTMFGHPNSLSGKTISALPFIWYTYPFLRNNWIKFLLIVQVVFSLNIIIFTGSRTGYVAIIFLAGFIYILSENKGKLILALIMIGIITINFLPDEYKGRFTTIYYGQEEQGRSKDARITLFKDSLTVFMENPLGVGPACFRTAQKNAGRRAQDTHNLYTQLLAETGIQGFVAFVVLMALLIKKISRLRRGYQNCIDEINVLLREDYFNNNDLSDELKGNQFGLAVCNALTVYIFSRLVLGILGHDLFEIYWWVAIGLSISLTNILAVSENRVAEMKNTVEQQTSNSSSLSSGAYN